jgi:hypothetical protein
MLEAELIEHLPGLANPASPVQRVTVNVATNADSLGTWFLEEAGAPARLHGDPGRRGRARLSAPASGHLSE